MKKRNPWIERILCTQLLILLLMITFFFMPDEFQRHMFGVLAVSAFAFLVLGIVLIVLSWKQKGKLRVFLLLAGFSAPAPLVLSILHNFFYALGIMFENLAFIFEPLHAISFIISLLVAPIAFLVGAIGSIVLIRK